MPELVTRLEDTREPGFELETVLLNVEEAIPMPLGELVKMTLDGV